MDACSPLLLRLLFSLLAPPAVKKNEWPILTVFFFLVTRNLVYVVHRDSIVTVTVSKYVTSLEPNRLCCDADLSHTQIYGFRINPRLILQLCFHPTDYSLGATSQSLLNHGNLHSKISRKSSNSKVEIKSFLMPSPISPSPAPHTPEISVVHNRSQSQASHALVIVKPVPRAFQT